MISLLFFLASALTGAAGVIVWIWLSGRQIVKDEDAYWGRTRD